MTITKNVWKAAAVLLILSLVSAVMISGTYAKYTSTFAGEDTALVAKWEITGNGEGFAVSGGALTLDLFKHAYVNNITNSTGGAYVIAPGVSGDFTVQFTNNSDVAASVNFAITTTGSAVDVPIKYGFTTGAGLIYDASGLQTALNTEFATITQGGIGLSKTVYWGWDFGDDSTVTKNTSDTALGIASAANVAGHTTYGLTISATAEQKTPTE